MNKDDRLWMRFPIAFDEDPWIQPLSDAAFRAFVEMNGYSRRNDLDGVIPARYAVKRWGAEVLQEIADARPDSPFFVVTSDHCILTKYERHQDTTEARAKRSAINRENGRQGGRKRVANRVASEPLSETQANSSEPQAESETESETRKAFPTKRAIPDDWQPNEGHYAKAKELQVDLKREAATFRAHAEANGRHVVRWDAAFTQWLLKANPIKAEAVDWMNR